MNCWKLIILLAALTVLVGCEAKTGSNKTASNSGAAKPAKDLSTVERPDSIKQKMEARGDQDKAEPELMVESPKEGETINSSTVRVKVKVDGDLKMGKDEKGTGNHVHVILDNQPYAAHYMWDEGFELRNVSDGEHTLRMFASRPW
ncbi:MAG: hypothetical protein HKN25_17170, partial [Pyrinomonadaceae bacterium]|nr:hypothetical protein [Pyrinomonadaceae bacterium]